MGCRERCRMRPRRTTFDFETGCALLEYLDEPASYQRQRRHRRDEEKYDGRCLFGMEAMLVSTGHIYLVVSL